MIRTTFGRFDGSFESCCAGEHHDFSVGPGLLELRQQVEAVRVRQIQIQQNDIGGFSGEQFFQRGTVFGFGDSVFAFQNGLEQQA